MPTYEYECETCGHHFEVFQSMNDPKLKKCPAEACGGEVRRLLGTGAGLIFKGSGFYQTDYRSDSYKEGVKKEQGASKSESGGSDSSSSSTTKKESTSTASAPSSTKE